MCIMRTYDVCAMVELGVETACGRRPGGVEVALTGTVLTTSVAVASLRESDHWQAQQRRRRWFPSPVRVR